jgi:hypothetical protein
MDKIDRLGWAAGTCIDAFGARIGIRVSDAAVLGRLPARLPPGWTPSGSPVVDHLYSLVVGGRRAQVRRYNLLYSGVLRRARSQDLDRVLDVFESDLRLSVAARARRRVFVHAGVVAWNGRAILLPGRSCSGKTTLVAALLQAGATYYSDEFAVLDRRGRVHPFPKPLSIREGEGRGIRMYPPEVLGGVQGVGPLPVGLVVVSEYRCGARWLPTRLTPGQGLLALLSNTVPARLRPAASVAALQRVVSRAVILKGARGEAEAMVAKLIARTDEPLPAASGACRLAGRTR